LLKLTFYDGTDMAGKQKFGLTNRAFTEMPRTHHLLLSDLMLQRFRWDNWLWQSKRSVTELEDWLMLGKPVFQSTGTFAIPPVGGNVGRL
jgi:hypothetical protein